MAIFTAIAAALALPAFFATPFVGEAFIDEVGHDCD